MGIPTPRPTLVDLFELEAGWAEGDGEDDADAERPDGSREEAVEAAAVDDVDGRGCDELKEEALVTLEEEALVTLDIDVLEANPIVVKGDGFPGRLNVSVPRQVQFPQQYVFPPHGISPTAAESVWWEMILFNVHEEGHHSPLHGFAHWLDPHAASVQLPWENMFGLILGLIVVLIHKPFSKQAQPLPQQVDSVAEGLHGESSGE